MSEHEPRPDGAELVPVVDRGEGKSVAQGQAESVAQGPAESVDPGAGESVAQGPAESVVPASAGPGVQGSVPAPQQPNTTEVAAALAALDTLPERELSEHPDLYQRIHADLQGALNAIDDA